MFAKDTPPLANMTCSRFLNSNNGDFDILIQLLFDYYIANERVAEQIQIIPKLKEFDVDTNKVIDQDSFSIITETIQYKVDTYNNCNFYYYNYLLYRKI